MSVALNVPKDELLPENDTQELWKLCGRVEALRGMILAKMEKDPNPLFYGKDICAVMGWKHEE